MYVLSTMTRQKPKQKPNKIVATPTLLDESRRRDCDAAEYGTDSAKSCTRLHVAPLPFCLEMCKK
jgi:hypothetical protein